MKNKKRKVFVIEMPNIIQNEAVVMRRHRVIGPRKKLNNKHQHIKENYGQNIRTNIPSI